MARIWIQNVAFSPKGAVAQFGSARLEWIPFDALQILRKTVHGLLWLQTSFFNMAFLRNCIPIPYFYIERKGKIENNCQNMSDISHSWMVKYEMPASDVNWYGLCIHSRHFGTIAIFYKTKTPIWYQEYISRGVILKW